MEIRKWAAVLPAAIAVCCLCCLAALSSRQSASQSGSVVIGSYATDLGPRTPHQRYNARRAAAAIDGFVIGPGRVFSFNRTVRGWSADRGFLKAPVSYDGVLVDDYGGGVCQTSTTIYNAALIAGLPILERHAHSFAPGYVPPGRDAAVAYSGIDLRFKNPFSWPLVLHISPDAHMLVCRILSAKPDPERVDVRSSVLDRTAPAPILVDPAAGIVRPRWHLAGRDGVRVVVYREFTMPNGSIKRESVSDDTYRPISRAEWRAW
jgi:vancomycin resistance protein YoaR